MYQSPANETTTKEIINYNPITIKFNKDLNALIYGGIIYDLPKPTSVKIDPAKKPFFVTKRGSQFKWDSIPGTLTEAQLIQKLLKTSGSNVELLSDSNASEESIKKYENIVYVDTVP